MRAVLASLLVLLAAACQAAPAPSAGDDDPPPGQEGRCEAAWSSWALALRVADINAADRALRDLVRRCSAADIQRVSELVPVRDTRGNPVFDDVLAYLASECPLQGPPVSNSPLCRELVRR